MFSCTNYSTFLEHVNFYNKNLLKSTIHLGILCILSKLEVILIISFPLFPVNISLEVNNISNIKIYQCTSTSFINKYSVSTWKECNCGFKISVKKYLGNTVEPQSINMLWRTFWNSLVILMTHRFLPFILFGFHPLSRQHAQSPIPGRSSLLQTVWLNLDSC